MTRYFRMASLGIFYRESILSLAIECVDINFSFVTVSLPTPVSRLLSGITTAECIYSLEESLSQTAYRHQMAVTVPLSQWLLDWLTTAVLYLFGTDLYQCHCDKHRSMISHVMSHWWVHWYNVWFTEWMCIRFHQLLVAPNTLLSTTVEVIVQVSKWHIDCRCSVDCTWNLCTGMHCSSIA